MKGESFIAKIVVVGDSDGITIPKRNMEFSGLKRGDIIKVWYEKENETV